MAQPSAALWQGFAEQSEFPSQNLIQLDCGQFASV